MAPYFETAKSFANVPITDEGVETASFLLASADFVNMFDLLGNGVFGFVQMDLKNNLAGVRDRYEANVSGSATLEQLVVMEIVTMESRQPSEESSATILPQKRKTRESDDQPSRTHEQPANQVISGLSNSQLSKGEYETGRVVCEACGEGVSFRDESTGGFTVQHWEAHRLQCPNSTQQTTDLDPQLQDVGAEVSQPQAKRRRAKRTEEERIEYLRTDPYVAQFEAYRVLCASCNKWIRLRPNSTYCSIPWDAHRKSCLAKRVAKSAYPADDRKAVLSTDPAVRKYDAERALCNICEAWVPLGTGNDTQAIKKWLEHRSSCQQDVSGTPTSVAASSTIPTIDSVPPPSRHQLALASSSSLPGPSHRIPSINPPPVKSDAVSDLPSPTSFKDLNPTNFFPDHEPRRRNAEQRAAQLRADPLLGDVEPNRVFCRVCQKWVQLRQDSSYCAYPWQQHRSKCLKRQEKRSQREANLPQIIAVRPDPAFETVVSEREDDSDDVETEEGVDSGEDRHRPPQKHDERRAVVFAKATHGVGADPRRDRSSVSDASDGDGDLDDHGIQSRLADLDTPLGRLEFTLRSIRHLFRSTYRKTDDLTIAALVTYLNAAMPPDKHEDFDTSEVTKAAMTLHERGCFVFQGDVLRLVN
ncbi:uncharacterized protein FIBRA_04740 [Fibroporia radiculosa]|uniref:Glycolipid transfer protein domain-containing protein n=1 Tax=Fibroporia radiculosa TaxID=599839 RepID=J4IAB8_9APHY|nr:uncharacterized protein FIBRA_04740 [Fibroporia radiculosa]CCM02636.1 predicted protein [Fibroporia radiculosa]